MHLVVLYYIYHKVSQSNPESFTSGNLISIAYKNVKTNLKVQNNSKTRMVGM